VSAEIRRRKRSQRHRGVRLRPERENCPIGLDYFLMVVGSGVRIGEVDRHKIRTDRPQEFLRLGDSRVGVLKKVQ
jgi:hypothetical protein